MKSKLPMLLVQGSGARAALSWVTLLAGSVALTGVVLVAAAGAETGARAVLAPCAVPPEFENRLVVVDGDIEVTIASESTKYGSGDIITIFILYKTLGASTFRLERPNSPMHGFSDLPDTCKSSRQAGCDAALLHHIPFVVLPVFDSMGLAPGECDSWSYPWNGRDRNNEPLLGRFTILGGIWDRAPVLVLHDYGLPGGGAPLGIEFGAVSGESMAAFLGAAARVAACADDRVQRPDDLAGARRR